MTAPAFPPLHGAEEGDQIYLRAGHKGRSQTIVCTEWNARRLLGMLSMMLGLPLQAKAAKRIAL